MPYVLASVAGQVFLAARGAHPTTSSVLFDFAYEATFGIYYYVFVAVLLTLFIRVLVRVPTFVIPALISVSLGYQLGVELGLIAMRPFFWELRNPLLFTAYFLLGWILRPRRERVSEWLARRRRRVQLGLGAVILAGLSCAALPQPGPAARVAIWLCLYATVALLFTLASRWKSTPRAVTFLSDVSYFVYLYHLFVVLPILRTLNTSPTRIDWTTPLLSWFAALAVSLGAAALLRRALGPRSRLLFGT